MSVSAFGHVLDGPPLHLPKMDHMLLKRQCGGDLCPHDPPTLGQTQRRDADPSAQADRTARSSRTLKQHRGGHTTGQQRALEMKRPRFGRRTGSYTGGYRGYVPVAGYVPDPRASP